MTRRRAVVAALLAALGATVGVAGVGHAYLRAWRRAVAWFSIVVGAGLVLVSVYADPATLTPSNAPTTVTVPVLALLLVSVFDAYRVGLRRAGGAGSSAPSPAGDAAEASCPSCGRSLDPTMDFCWYCATPLDGEVGEPDPEEPATSR